MARGADRYPSIFGFDDYLAYLHGVRHSGRRPLTFSRWATQLGYRSPRLIAMVVGGCRLPSSELIQKLVEQLKLSPREARYFELLVLKEKLLRRKGDPSKVVAEIRAINPTLYVQRFVPGEIVPFISNWYHVVIKQLLSASPRWESPEKLFRKLRGKVPLAKIERSLRTLVRLGFFERDERGALKPRAGNIQTPIDIPDDAVRNHHRGMLQRALEALDERPVDTREFTTLTFRADPLAMERMKKRIREFRAQIDQEFESATSEHVFQLNVQLFEHTE